MSTPNTSPVELITQYMHAWTRLGVMFTVSPSRTPVDVERLVADTAICAPQNERLFVMAATWLSVRHQLVDGRRLKAAVATLDAHSSAVAGAMLSVAASAVSGKTALDAAIAQCRPLPQMAPLFQIMNEYPSLLKLTQAETLDVYRKWGFWHNDAVLKFDAVRPVRWTLRHCPELRARALLGHGLDAQVVDALMREPHTVMELTDITGATYAATYAATTRLAERGLLDRPTGEGPKRWCVAPSFTKAVQLAFN